MKIHNVRLGLAANSSSTHSLIFIDPRETTIDWMASHDDADGDFGWGFWTAALPESKARYAAHTVYESLARAVGSEIALIVTKEWTGVNLPTGENWNGEVGAEGYIDHQSLYMIPNGYGSKTPDSDFAKEFFAYMTQENLVILGGNDNDPNNHPLADQGSFMLPVPRDTIGTDWTCRKDESQGIPYWTLFHKKNGAKMRLSFKQVDGFEPTKAKTPELVDIKITDYCPFNCAFCYQDSTVKGRHADKSAVTSLAYTLRDLKVFEVALGGGEPTLHPGFVDILQTFRWNNIVPNFTTKSLGWLKDEEQRKKILDLAGGFAYSATTAAEVQELADLITDARKLSDWNTQVSVHYVVGTATQAELKKIMAVCAENYLRLTLLGYKTVGRGHKFEPLDNDWIKAAQESREAQKYVNLAIDTPLAAEYEEQILAAGISPRLFHTEEGKFSMYIDMVDQRLGPSSYCEPGKYVPFTNRSPRRDAVKEITTAFAQW